jgi:hypothetical protein
MMRLVETIESISPHTDCVIVRSSITIVNHPGRKGERT